MILGLIGGLLGIPCTLASLSLAKSAGLDVDVTVQVYLYLAFAGCGIGLLFSLLAKKAPILSGSMQLVGAACVGISIIGAFVLNVPTFLLFLIGAVITYAQKREPIK